MRNYVRKIINEFAVNIIIARDVRIPETDNLFKVDVSKTLNKNKAGLFHKNVARGLFLCKRARPDIQPTIAVLCTRVKHPSQEDCYKLLRLMNYLVGTQ